ncbi:MAG TPA: hypothetical protein GX715_12170 [Armatimonadetes bacterium]|jgi:hypothetical protein|nr:hypothetical protein [Armatimonadota bacterium]
MGIVGLASGSVIARGAMRGAFVCVLALFPVAASAAWLPGTFMAKALARVIAAQRESSLKADYGWDRGVCLMGALLKPGESLGVSRTLRAGESYLFVAGGSDGATGLTLSLLNSQGMCVAQDARGKATSVVTYSPASTELFSIRIRSRAASQPGFCALGLFREHGTRVHADHVATTAAELIARSSRLAERARGARFSQEPKQWALFGTIMQPGDTQTIPLRGAGRARHAILAAGDGNARNLDLFLLDASGRSRRKNSQPSAHPFLVYETRKGCSYRLRWRNTESRGASLVITAILDIGIDG